MSGYQATELVLANVPRPVAPVLEALRGYLAHEHEAREHECYVIQEPYGAAGPTECWEPLEPTDGRMAEAVEVGYGVRLDLELRVGPYGHFAMLCIVPVGEREVSFTLKLASSVIDAIYRHDRSMEELDDEAKRGLVALCLGTTAAAGAEGFLLQRDQQRLSPITAEQIAAELRVRARPWEIGGVAHQRLPLRELWRIKETKDPAYVYESVTGLTVYDLVHTVEY